jgi:hypothetical protein
MECGKAEAEKAFYCELSHVAGKSRTRGCRMGVFPIHLNVTWHKHLMYINLRIGHCEILQISWRVEKTYAYRRVSRNPHSTAGSDSGKEKNY